MGILNFSTRNKKIERTEKKNEVILHTRGSILYLLMLGRASWEEDNVVKKNNEHVEFFNEDREKKRVDLPYDQVTFHLLRTLGHSVWSKR